MTIFSSICWSPSFPQTSQPFVFVDFLGCLQALGDINFTRTLSKLHTSSKHYQPFCFSRQTSLERFQNHDWGPPRAQDMTVFVKPIFVVEGALGENRSQEEH